MNENKLLGDRLGWPVAVRTKYEYSIIIMSEGVAMLYIILKLTKYLQLISKSYFPSFLNKLSRVTFT